MKAPWFFQGHFLRVQSSTLLFQTCSKLHRNDFTSLELHGNGQNSHDFNVFIIDLKGFQNVCSWAPACSKVVELLFRRAQHTPRKLTISCQKYSDLSYLYVFPVILCLTCYTITVSFVRSDLKLHAFWYLSKSY